MKVRLFFALIVVFVSTLLEVGFAIDNPAGVATVPPSSIRSGLIRSPNPIDTSGNLMVTGNVSGGRHFRGVVPYNAISDFGGRLGTGTLDSFLRYSAGSGDFSRYAGRVAPYYSQTGTVTTTRLGQSGVIRPPTTKILGRVTKEPALPSLLKKHALAPQGLSFPQKWESYSRFRPMSMTPQEIERTILAEVSTYTRGSKSTDAPEASRLEGTLRGLLQSEVPTKDVWQNSISGQNQKMWAERGQVRQELKQAPLEGEYQRELPYLRRTPGTVEAEKRVAEALLSRGLTSQGKALYLQTGKPAKTDAMQLQEPILQDPLRKDSQMGTPFELQKPVGQTDKVATARFGQDEWGPKRDKGRLGTQFTPARERLGATALREQGKLEGFSTTEKGAWSPEVDVYEQIKQQIDSLGLPRIAGPREGYGDSYLADLESTARMPGMSYEQQAKAIRGPHETFASFSRAKFNQHVRAAEEHLKQGKYYRAADAYTLASVYEPEDALVYVGKSHALLAAGEYMSSALFLSRALEILPAVPPEYEKTSEAKSEEPRTVESDNLALFASSFRLIDRDKLEDRIVDVEQWQKKNDSAELQFLLGYIYYQMGRFDQAKEAVGEARKKMPGKQSVIMLEKAIDSQGQKVRHGR